jgi:hypothetical protein
MALLDHRPAIRRPSRRLSLLGLLPLALLLLGGAWWISRHTGYDSAGLPNGPVSYAQITAHPEAHLYYPGSRVFAPFGGPERNYLTIDGQKHDPAFAGAVLTSNATPAQIYLWYQLWLLKHGWRSHGYVGATTWRSWEGYARGTREELIVAIDYPDLLGETLGRRLPPARTVYELSYTILPAGQSVP